LKRILFAAALCAASPVHAQSALEFAAAGMGKGGSENATFLQAKAGKRNRNNALRLDPRFARRLIRSESMLAGVYGPLADKAREIEGACGSRVISGVRRGARVAGTRRMSLHSVGRAVDIRGNPRCAYAMLRDWPGGVSVDYGRVGHIHFSYDPHGGREMHARFSHGGHRRRYAWR